MPTLPQTTVLGPLEHSIMRIVWAHDRPITVRYVYKILSADHDLAYTTIMTTMTRLADKGVLICAPGTQKGRGGAAYLYRSAVSRHELLLLAVEQVLASLGANAAERQHVAAAVQQRSI